MGGPDAAAVLGGGVEGPQQLARFGVVGLHEAPDAVFAAVGAYQDHVLDHGGRHRLGIAQRRVTDLRFPQLLAGLGVERDQLGVERAHEDLVARHGDAAVVRAAAGLVHRAERVAVMPDLRAGTRVERIDVVERRRDVHDAVHDDRRGFEAVHDLGLEDPCRTKVLDVVRVDLRRGVVPRLAVIVVGMKKVVPVARGAAQHVLRDRLHVAVERAGRCFLLRGNRTAHQEHSG